MIRKKRTGNLKRSKFLKKQGFTLIELVVVMAIIAVLAVLVIGAITIAKHMATETANRSNAKTIQTAMEAYYSRHQAYPPMNGASFYRAATDASYQITPSFVSLSSLSNSVLAQNQKCTLLCLGSKQIKIKVAAPLKIKSAPGVKGNTHHAIAQETFDGSSKTNPGVV